MRPGCDMPSDAELMAQVRSGDTEAFAALVERHRPRLCAFFYRLCRDREEAGDAAQETLVRLWLARDGYEARAKFTTYLYRIAWNHWLNRLRAMKSRPRVTPLEEQLGEGGKRLLRQMLLRARPTEDAVLRRYRMQRIRSAIARLPQRQRIVFVLSHFEGLRYAEISEVLGIPVGTVKSRMHHAVARLRELLSNDPLSF